jgi:hypothetical protein
MKANLGRLISKIYLAPPFTIEVTGFEKVEGVADSLTPLFLQLQLLHSSLGMRRYF